jgi:putative acetyltransferase
LPGANLPVEFRVDNAERLEFADGSFDGCRAEEQLAAPLCACHSSSSMLSIEVKAFGDTVNQAAQVCIHAEHAEDSPQIRAVVEAAFTSPPLGHHGEADLIERLRRVCPETLSLVAKHEDHIVGHVLFSPVVIEEGNSLCGMGLGPVAVSPAFQRRGVGTRLITEGIEILRKRGCLFVCVLGHPLYYPRFGFESAQQLGIDSEFGGASDGTFQILWLRKNPGTPKGAVVRYRPEFSSVGH